ncbi:hypothetical protein [Mesorhizobium sp. B2-4-17]|uniref:hypothetical protein n=1 Tax=Mesorhizobium sp. B2-4-17 TaxID=2589932 RepID=UPI00112EB106|nr:hypothetical protein [Mesorhizobium sp. B2-4-17]TPK70078.1 hypothetical protein FJ548_29580 [Mesorhizobium sp. B2-4-17]
MGIADAEDGRRIGLFRVPLDLSGPAEKRRPQERERILPHALTLVLKIGLNDVALRAKPSFEPAIVILK